MPVVLTTADKPCKDCQAEGITSRRVLATLVDGRLAPGPRCVTHHRAKKRSNRIRAHEIRVEKTYELSPAEYDAILTAQGGRCFVCRKARGAKRFLAVDHDHHAHDGEIPLPHAPEVGCRRCVRCLACDTCNRIVLGRYDVDALVRAIVVLTDPPARKVLRDKEIGNGTREHAGR